LVRTKTQEVLARQAILALGPWLGRALPKIAPLLEVTRQAVGWFKAVRPETVSPDRFPVFILERGPTMSSMASRISNNVESKRHLTITDRK